MKKGGRKMKGSPKTRDKMDSSQSSTSDESQSPNVSASMEKEIGRSEENRLSQLMNQVFNESLLREIIIDYVIHHGKRVSSAGIKTCRLVKKSWLHTVSELLRKQRTPLLYLHLDKENSLQESDIVQQQGGKLLDRFLNNALTSPSFENGQTPPFSIKATQDFFKEENYANFRDVLLKFGNGLVNMDLEIPKNGGSMPFIFPFSSQRSLPILTNFTVRFAYGYGTDGSNAISIHLIESILNASHHALKSFYLPDTFLLGNIPSGIGYLTLPVSLTKLDLSAYLKNKDLNMLLNNRLPNLKDLSLRITQTAFDDGMMSRILAGLSETLVKLAFYKGYHDGVPSRPTYFQLPAVMKNLKEISVLSTHLELQNGLSSLETSLPEMKHLVLKNQTVTMFRKWTANSKFVTVTELQISLVDANFASLDKNYCINIGAEIMHCLHLAFPNLKVLKITVCGAEMSGLEYLFLEMKQLEDLVIHVRGTENLANSDYWDSLLLGIRLDFATAMRTLPGFCETFEIKDVTRPSIRNLSKLRALSITTGDWDLSTDLAKTPIISESVFHFGFLKMPNLMKLKLVFHGRFTASKEMESKWMAKPGRSIFIF